MTTPLQKAAQALLDCDETGPIRKRFADLRKALDAEIAQAVEPVTDDIVAGALYDFLGYLTSRRTRITMSDRDDAGAAADALVDWSKTRKINLAEARVVDWNDYTHPPKPQSTTAVPEGYVLVPIEPTDEELSKGVRAMRLFVTKNSLIDFSLGYKAMLAAAQGEKP